MIACITMKEGWLVLCWDGGPVIHITPPDPHEDGWADYQEAYDALFQVYPNVELIGTENWYLTVNEGAKKEFTVRYIHTGKFEATYKVRAKSQFEADDYVDEHHLELDPIEVFPLSDDYERYL